MSDGEVEERAFAGVGTDPVGIAGTGDNRAVEDIENVEGTEGFVDTGRSAHTEGFEGTSVVEVLV